jgi:hypothetical protein
MPFGETSAESKSSALSKQILDPGPDEKTIVVVGICDDAIVELVAYLGEQDVR